MMIDMERIENAVLYQGKAKEAAERLGLTTATINQYRANPEAKAWRNWRKMDLEVAQRIMEVFAKEDEQAAEIAKYWLDYDVTEKQYDELPDEEKKALLAKNREMMAPLSTLGGPYYMAHYLDVEPDWTKGSTPQLEGYEYIKTVYFGTSYCLFKRVGA